MSLTCQPLTMKFFLMPTIVVLSDFCADRLSCFNSRNYFFSCMFEKLRQKWKVNALQLTLILFTFAIGGSLTGFVAKKVMYLLKIEADWLWAIVYIFLITVIWPIMVILVSIPFGQFRFFRNYTRKLGEKLGIIKTNNRDQESEARSQK